MSERQIRLYGIPLSHPTIAVRGMIERKGLPYRYVELLGGTHPPSLWALGFRGATVPAMKFPDGRRVQGSLAIAQALEQAAPEPSLYPSDPEARKPAQDAERWGESVLQPVPRRMIRWGLRRGLPQRRWFVENATPLPAPAVTGALLTPLASLFARGVIGGDQLGAADFQIGASLRMLLAFEDVGRLVAGRPAEQLARRVAPDYPDIPAALPPEWLPATG